MHNPLSATPRLQIVHEVGHWSEEQRAELVAFIQEMEASITGAGVDADSATAATRTDTDTDTPEGWGSSQLVTALAEVSRSKNGDLIVKAMRQAAVNGGFVSRDEVFQLGGFNEDRSLRGFGRPCKRVTLKLKQDGLLALDAPQLFRTVYGNPAEPSIAQGFEVPRELIPTLVTLKAK